MKRRLVAHLLNHVGWKLFALAVACALWVTFAGSPELVTSVSAPVEFQNMPQDLEMSSDTPERIYLEVRGSSSRLHGFELSHTSVVLNLASVRGPGEQTFTLDRGNIDLPYGVSLVRAIPGQLRLRFEALKNAEVPVRLRFSHPPPAGYRVSRASVEPPKVKIVGPESRVKDVGYAETDPINLANGAFRSEFRVHTFIPDPQVRLVSSPVVTVKIELEKSAKGG